MAVMKGKFYDQPAKFVLQYMFTVGRECQAGYPQCLITESSYMEILFIFLALR